MKKTKLPILLFLLFLFSHVAFSQERTEAEKKLESQKAHDLRTGKDENGMIKQPTTSPTKPHTTAELKEIHARQAREANEKLIALKEAEQRLLAPPQYYEKFAKFLKNKKTGLARLFVDKGCGVGKIAAADTLKDCGDVIPVRGGGAFYSFRYKSNHFYGIDDGWDIYLYNGNKFLAGNKTVQTLITNIGDINLEELNLKSNVFNFLEDYEPAATVAEIKEKNKILRIGVNFGGYSYSNAADVNDGSAYVLRTIAYKTNKFADNGLDLTVAFKIVGREPDGSLVILWKEFKSDLPRKTL